MYDKSLTREIVWYPMPHKPTFASVTDIQCTCESLQRSAADPVLPVRFDPATGEFQFVYNGPGGKGEGYMVIYHCPFCGGTAPQSKRHLLFAVISREEQERLAPILAPLRTIRQALKSLGPADRDGLLTGVEESETDDKPPKSRKLRTLVYQNLSPTADIWITDTPAEKSPGISRANTSEKNKRRVPSSEELRALNQSPASPVHASLCFLYVVYKPYKTTTSFSKISIPVHRFCCHERIVGSFSPVKAPPVNLSNGINEKKNPCSDERKRIPRSEDTFGEAAGSAVASDSNVMRWGPEGGGKHPCEHLKASPSAVVTYLEHS